MISRVLVAAVILLALLAQGTRAADVFVEALLPGVAVMKIDGQRVTLRAGQSKAQVKLISADASKAVVEIAGRRQELRVSQRISSAYSEPERRALTVRRDQNLQYRTFAEINGVRLPVLIDTGANVVAMNGNHARRIGISADSGVASQVQTAGSIVPARSLVLDSVEVGGIRVNRVAATVIEGEFPVDILLGISFLQHVDLQESAGILTLQERR